MGHISEKNADRFTGFADIYDEARPVMPTHTVSVITRYLGHRSINVVDLGCGTGLSTVIWSGNCEKAVGIEPNEDMLSIARNKENSSISFRKGFSHATGLPDSFADVVVCSQSFHWMEPVSTLLEVDRLLTEGGVFATIDCDWPPVSDWRVEKAYIELYDKVHHLELVHPDISGCCVRYSKNEHLENIRASGHFRFAREIVFSQAEPCDAKRMIGLLISQGSLQEVLRKAPALIESDVVNFQTLVKEVFGDQSFSVEFSYRMRIAVK